MLRTILKALATITAAFVLYSVCVGMFGRTETRYEFKGQKTVLGNSQPQMLYAKLTEPKWWARIGSDNGIRLWVEIPNESVLYFNELREVGEGLQIFDNGLLVVNLSQLSGALTLKIGEKSFYDGMGAKIEKR